ncbi:MAG TPA: DUF1569 domain-containing protein, partial [Phycisphaerales bacterium]|nr:DUF1569 domain-containing protein [Phycisphaerales bacterium]
MVNTKEADRRALAFTSLDELKADLDRIESAHASGDLEHTGNWTPAQICDHLAAFWAHSLDGFPPGKPPLPIRVLMQMLFKKKAVSGQPPPPGFPIPSKAAFLLPNDSISFSEALARLRMCIDRTMQGDPFVEQSPLFGRL